MCGGAPSLSLHSRPAKLQILLLSLLLLSLLQLLLLEYSINQPNPTKPNQPTNYTPTPLTHSLTQLTTKTHTTLLYPHNNQSQSQSHKKTSDGLPQTAKVLSRLQAPSPQVLVTRQRRVRELRVVPGTRPRVRQGLGDQRVQPTALAARQRRVRSGVRAELYASRHANKCK